MSNTANDRTIKIGIDFGTTNSEIAISVNGTIEIIKNALQDEYTSSVFGYDKAGNKVIGKKAYEKLFRSSSEDEFENNKAEVKRLMGTAQKVHFKRPDIDMNAEEISAEILKSLKEDVKRKYPEFDTASAVITVPAYFSALQAEATKRAGQLAGFEYVVLLQEPIAAAMAYGFNNTADENWLVYDLGGGTFDVALISSKEGILTVLGHGGNNFLGGKDFDNLIIDQVIRPAILEKYDLKEFDRNNPKYRSVFAKLKALAEASKIELSQYTSTTIEIDEIGKDDQGDDIYLSIDFKRNEFEDLVRPKVNETIVLAHKTIKDAGVKSTAIDKIVLVGGPTQIPFLREELEKEFQATIDASVDPLTVVARGACVFALSQQLPEEMTSRKRESVQEEKKVTIYYESLTSEDEQTVTGLIEELKEADEDYYIQIQSDSGSYSSSKLKLKNGKFFDTLALEPRKTNLFWIYLFDSAGNAVPAFPDSFSITNGLTVSGSPLPDGIGVVYAKRAFASDFQLTEVCDPFFEKNNIPPLKHTETYKTINKLEKGQDNKLPIKIYEGDSKIPDRNTIITQVHIDGKKLPYDLPEASEIDITISVDESRTITVEAYIPSVEMSFNARADIHSQEIKPEELKKELDAQRERVESISDSFTAEEGKIIRSRIDTIGTSIKNSELDDDERSKADRDLRELKMQLDEIESDRAMPQLKKDYEQLIIDVQSFIDALDDMELRQRSVEMFELLCRESEKAIKDGDKALLMRTIEQIRELGVRSLTINPSFWVWQLQQIKESSDELTNQQDGAYYIKKAEEAISRNDVDELQRCVRNLMDLLPTETQEEIRSNISGVTK